MCDVSDGDWRKLEAWRDGGLHLVLYTVITV